MRTPFEDQLISHAHVRGRGGEGGGASTSFAAGSAALNNLSSRSRPTSAANANHRALRQPARLVDAHEQRARGGGDPSSRGGHWRHGSCSSTGSDVSSIAEFPAAGAAGSGGAGGPAGWVKTWSLKDFRIGARIGAGRASAVYHALHKSTGMNLALKCYLRDKVDDLTLSQIEREIAIHASVSHPAITNFYGSFEDERGNIYLLHEYAKKGDVFGLISKCGGVFSEAQTCRQVIGPVAAAVSYLHARNIIHRDIKPENLLVSDADSGCKLTDFGFAIDHSKTRTITRLGTTDYMAPEIVRCDKQRRTELRRENESGYGVEVDCWAIGVLAYECLLGHAPFEGGSVKDVYGRILEGRLTIPPHCMSWQGEDFIRRSLAMKPEERLTAAEMLRHPWIETHCGKWVSSSDRAANERADLYDDVGSGGGGGRTPVGRAAALLEASSSETKGADRDVNVNVRNGGVASGGPGPHVTPTSFDRIRAEHAEPLGDVSEHELSSGDPGLETPAVVFGGGGGGYIFSTSQSGGGGGGRLQDGRVADYRSASSPMGAGVVLRHDRDAGSFQTGGGRGEAAAAGGSGQPGSSDVRRANGHGRSYKDDSLERSEGREGSSRLQSNSFTHRMHHTVVRRMRGIGKVREFIYSGNSYDLSQQSSQEGEPRINSAFRRSRPQSSTHGSMQSGEDGAHGRDEDMDDAFADGMILSPAADRDGAVPFVPPQGR